MHFLNLISPWNIHTGSASPYLFWGNTRAENSQWWCAQNKCWAPPFFSGFIPNSHTYLIFSPLLLFYWHMWDHRYGSSLHRKPEYLYLIGNLKKTNTTQYCVNKNDSKFSEANFTLSIKRFSDLHILWPSNIHGNASSWEKRTCIHAKENESTLSFFVMLITIQDLKAT